MAEPTPHPSCEDIIKIKEWKANHEARHDTIDEILNKLTNRLPLWATFAMSGLTAIIGWLLAAR